jgi:uncharacterized protein YxjI
MEKTFTTIGDITITYRDFITGRQQRYIKDAFTEDVEFENKGGEQTYKVEGRKLNISIDRSIEAVIVKVEGAGVDPANKVLDQVLDLPAEDYNEVLGKVNEVTKDKKKVPPTQKT